MTTLKKHYTVKREDKRSHISLDILLERNPLLSLMVVPSHEDAVVKALESNIDLIGNERQINLFESITIMDKLDAAWLFAVDKTGYSEKLIRLTGDEITEIYVNYIENGVIPEWLTPDEEFNKLICLDECGEDVLLGRISRCGFVCNDDNASRLTLQQITTTFPSAKAVCLHDRGISYQSILDAARIKYGIALTESVELDDVVFEGSRRFMRSMFADTKPIKELCRIAYDAVNSLEFKKAIEALLKEYSIDITADGGYGDVSIGGYSLKGMHGLKKGQFTISVSGIHMAYLGYGDKLVEENSHVLETFKGKNLWETMWYEFARKHEESLEPVETVEVIERDDREERSEREVKFNMTIKQVQKRLKEEYGVEYTEGYVGKIIKDTLKKLKVGLEERGVAYEDAVQQVD